MKSASSEPLCDAHSSRPREWDDVTWIRTIDPVSIIVYCRTIELLQLADQEQVLAENTQSKDACEHQILTPACLKGLSLDYAC
jgi:hypothetical protein